MEKILFNLINAELNPIYHLPALLGAHFIFHISRIRVQIALLLDMVTERNKCKQMYKDILYYTICLWH
jgi:hypothetical protein